MHESVTADRVLRQLRERRSHQALVVDEFGGTAGLLTLEDVLSELLGDVGDEFKAGEPVPETLPDGRIRLPGDMAVDDAATLLRASGRPTRPPSAASSPRRSATCRRPASASRSATTSSRSSASSIARSNPWSRGACVRPRGEEPE